MGKNVILYIVSKSRDKLKWIEYIYDRTLKGAETLARKKLNENGIVAVKIDKVTREQVLYLEKEE